MRDLSLSVPFNEAAGNQYPGRSARSTSGKLTNTGKGVIVVGRFDFKGDGMDTPYNTLRAAKERKAEIVGDD